MTSNPIDVFVNLLEEEIDIMRLTKAIEVGDNKYKLLPIDNFENSGETWEFEPGSIVSLKKTRTFDGKTVLVASAI